MRRCVLLAALFLAAVPVRAKTCAIPLVATKTAFVAEVWIGSDGPLRFLVDTGATTTVIDLDVAARLGIDAVRRRTAVTTTGTIEVGEAVIGDLRAGELRVSDTPVLIADLPRFPNHGHLDGIMGMSMFAGHAITLNVRHRCMEIDEKSPRGLAMEGREVDGRVAIDVDGMQFVLDSAASFPVLTSHRAHALAVAGQASEVTTAAGRHHLMMATIPLFRVGSRTFRDVTVALGPSTDMRQDGLLPVTPFDSVYIAADRKLVIVQ